MSDKILEEIADLILDACDDVDEVEALIGNVLVLIAEQLDDEDWQPALQDLRTIHSDAKDDEEVSEGESEDLEVLKHPDGFISLK
tara:strand:- start:1104 stop:1358 length:255 start_codon:yes stop_codon:yes gene_type:complete